MSKLVSLKEAAHDFGVSESHMRRMISRERFPFYRLGSRLIRVDPEEIRRANIGIKNEKKPISLKSKDTVQIVSKADAISHSQQARDDLE